MVKFEQLWKNYPDEDPCDAKDEKGGKLYKSMCDTAELRDEEGRRLTRLLSPKAEVLGSFRSGSYPSRC